MDRRTQLEYMYNQTFHAYDNKQWRRMVITFFVIALGVFGFVLFNHQFESILELLKMAGASLVASGFIIGFSSLILLPTSSVGLEKVKRLAEIRTEATLLLSHTPNDDIKELKEELNILKERNYEYLKEINKLNKKIKELTEKGKEE